jgi:hypothetical protein
MTAQQIAPAISQTKLTGNMRTVALPRHFRQGMILVEAQIFYMMDKYCEQYNGGYWEFYSLSNNGFFMAPTGAESFRLVNAENYSDVALSGEAAGIAICLMAYSHLSWSEPAHIFNSHFHWLREFALNHPEASDIFRFID